jgi:hypothetical protein
MSRELRHALRGVPDSETGAVYDDPSAEHVVSAKRHGSALPRGTRRSTFGEAHALRAPPAAARDPARRSPAHSLRTDVQLVEQSMRTLQEVTQPSVTPVRSQAAFVRALLDDVERLQPAGASGPLSQQLVEELSRLGCRCIELAARLTETMDAEDATEGVRQCA